MTRVGSQRHKKKEALPVQLVLMKTVGVMNMVFMEPPILLP